MNNSPMVAIQMLTYNHERFIAQAIESVMMQVTNFDYKLIICEDFSTDKTRSICVEYKNRFPHKIDLVLNEKNIGVQLNALQVHKKCYDSNAKYVAIIEGDDFWTDCNKLQKQVNFLNENLDFNVCFHQVQELTNQDNIEKYRFYNSNNKSEFSFNDLIISNPIATVSCLYRNKLFHYNVFDEVKPYDDVFHLLNTETGKAKYMDDSMAVYRLHSGGIWSSKSLIQKYESNIKIRKMILDFFHAQPKHKSNTLFYFPLAELYKNFSMLYFEQKKIMDFLKTHVSYLYYAKKGQQLTSYRDFLKLIRKLIVSK